MLAIRIISLRRPSVVFRAALLACTAFVCVASPGSAEAACDGALTDGATVTCSGALSTLGTVAANDLTLTFDSTAAWVGPVNFGSLSGSNLNLTVEEGASISMSGSGANTINLGPGTGQLTINGKVLNNGGSGVAAINITGDGATVYEITLGGNAILSGNATTKSIKSDAQSQLTLNIGSGADIYGGIQALGSNDLVRFVAGAEGSYGIIIDSYYDYGFENAEVTGGTWSFTSSGYAQQHDILMTGGTLSLTGPQNASFTVQGGVLAGSGTIQHDLTVTDATVRPGDVYGNVGTLTVQGNATLGSGAILLINGNGTNASKLVVGGTLDINGASLQISPSVAFTPGAYTIVTAQQINNQFSSVSIGGGMSASVQYIDGATEDSVVLNAAEGSDSSGRLVPAAVTPSGTSAATVLDNARGNSQMTNLIAVLDALPAQQKAAALNSLSGQTTATTAIMPTAATASVVSTVLNHNTAMPGASAPARFSSNQSADAGGMTGISTGEWAPQMDRGAWVSVLGGFGSVDEKSGVAGSNSRTGGLAGGFDLPLREDGLTAGVSFGYVDSRTDIDDDGGNATAQAGFLGLYGRLEQWGLRLDGTLMAGRHYNDQRRNVTIGTATSTASGNNEGWSLGAGLQVSTPFQLAQRDDYSAVLRPFVGVTTQRYWQDAWSEDGAGTANLAYGSLIHDSFTSRLGAGWEFNIAAGEETRIAPMISLGWAHQFASNAPTMDAAFALLPDQRFSVSGARMDRDSLEVNLGVDVIDFGAGRTFTLGYGGSLARDAQDHTFSARARFAL